MYLPASGSGHAVSRPYSSEILERTVVSGMVVADEEHRLGVQNLHCGIALSLEVLLKELPRLLHGFLAPNAGQAAVDEVVEHIHDYCCRVFFHILKLFISLTS